MDYHTEYKIFFENFWKNQNLEFRQEPPIINPSQNFNFTKFFKKISIKENKIPIPLSLKEPLSYLQKQFGESLRYSYLLDTAAEQEKLYDIMSYVAAYIVSADSNACPYRTTLPFESSTGETYEFIDNNILMICEQVSVDPNISASNVQGKNWEYNLTINKIMKFKLNKIKITFIMKYIFNFKNETSFFVVGKINLILHKFTSDKRWHEYTGKYMIYHESFNDRVEINYLNCKKYKDNKSIEGLLFDYQEDCIGTFEGNYFKNLKLTKIDIKEQITLWEVDSNEKIFKEYFYFNIFTLKLNDMIHYVECQSDSRLRKDVRRLEHGDYERAEDYQTKYKENQKLFTKTSDSIKAIQPEWFKYDYDENNKIFNCIYKNEYWLKKINNINT